MKKKRPVRPIREDLVMQSCLEAYGAVRHEGRLADRALEFTLRHKRMLYSNERRAVAERVYALLRRQRLVDFMLERVHSGFAALPVTRQDLLRFHASALLSGEPLQAAAVPAADRSALAKLPSVREPPDFAIKASLPDFLAERFLREVGPDVSAMTPRELLSAPPNAL